MLDLGSQAADQWADFTRQIPLLRKRFAPWLDSTYYLFYVGTDDERFLKTNRELARELRSYRIPHVTFRIHDGSHSWSLWQSHAADWVQRGLALAAKPS